MSIEVGRLRSAVNKKRFFVFLPVILVGLVVLGVHHKRVWDYLLALTAAFQSIETGGVRTLRVYGALAPVISAVLMIFSEV